MLSKKLRLVKSSPINESYFKKRLQTQLISFALVGAALGFLVSVGLYFMRFEIIEVQKNYELYLLVFFGTLFGLVGGLLIGAGISFPKPPHVIA